MWATVSEADDFFDAEYGFSDWATLTSADKSSLLTTAYRTLLRDSNYVWPATATEQMAEANILLAYYIYSDPEMDSRKNLIQQGVKQFSIGRFSEEYKDSTVTYSAYPSRVADLIASYRVLGGAAYGQIYREPYER